MTTKPLCACGRSPVRIVSTAECWACYQRRRKNTQHYYPGGPVVKTAASYVSAHHRIHYWRGTAKAQMCVGCGGIAEEWSYNGDSKHEQSEMRADQKGVARLVTFSPNPLDYSARCRSSHISYDMKRGAA